MRKTLLLLILLALPLAACSDTDSAVADLEQRILELEGRRPESSQPTSVPPISQPTAISVRATPVPSAPIPAAPGMTAVGFSLLELVDAQPELSVLRSLLNESGLADTLESGGPFTLFAPTNDAFRSVTADVEQVRNDPERLQEFLLHHLLDGEVLFGEMQDPEQGSLTVQTLLPGVPIHLTIDSRNGVLVNDVSQVLLSDAKGRNGVMHIVNHALFPSSGPQSPIPVPGEPGAPSTIQGSFFTRGDENNGAVVAENLITVTFTEGDSATFQGLLDITYSDGGRVVLNMSGPITWTASFPQIEATLAGVFTLDAPIDTDDLTSNVAELSILSLESGSGSLCAIRCFGFTFPPTDTTFGFAPSDTSALQGATPTPEPTSAPRPQPTAVQVTIDDFGPVTIKTLDALVAVDREASAQEAFAAALSDPTGVERSLIQLGEASCDLIEQVGGDWDEYSLGVAIVAVSVNTPFEDLTEFDLMEATAFATCQSVYLTLGS